MANASIQRPRLIYVVSNCELVFGLILMTLYACMSCLAFVFGYFRHLEHLSWRAWSRQKWLETMLEGANYWTIIHAGKSGTKAIRPDPSCQVRDYYTDFLTYNTMGAIASVMQLIIQTIELWKPDPDTPPPDTAILWLNATNVVLALLTLVVQVYAVGLDCCWSGRTLVVKVRCVLEWMRVTKPRFAGYARVESSSLDVDNAGTAMTTANSSMDQCSARSSDKDLPVLFRI